MENPCIPIMVEKESGEMTICVIMSVYKTEEPKYFEEALKSIWDDQTRKPEQIVLVEDGRRRRQGRCDGIQEGADGEPAVCAGTR